MDPRRRAAPQPIDLRVEAGSVLSAVLRRRPSTAGLGGEQHTVGHAMQASVRPRSHDFCLGRSHAAAYVAGVGRFSLVRGMRPAMQVAAVRSQQQQQQQQLLDDEDARYWQDTLELLRRCVCKGGGCAL